MTKREHTPGPWRIDFDPEGDDCLSIMVDNGSGDVSAELAGRICEPANARLIAAAPELLTQALATAEMLEEQAEAMRPGAVREALQGRAFCLRDVIRKATEG